MPDIQPSSTLSANLAGLRAAGLPVAGAVRPADAEVEVGGEGNATTVRLRGADGRLVQLHSRRNPLDEAARWLDAVLDGAPPPPCLVVVGLGLGWVLDALEHRGAGTSVLALEPEPAVVPAFLARRDWRAWLERGRLTILSGPDYNGAGDAWRRVPDGTTTAPVLVHPVLQRERPEATKKAAGVAARILFDARANAESRSTLAGVYLLHTLANAAAIAREGDVDSLSDRFAGVPAIVVGAGPSLDGNIEALRGIGDRALVMAADTALRPLLGAGIRPHVVVAADPSDHNTRHLQNLPPCPGTWLAAEGSVGSEAFEAFHGRAFTFRISTHEPWPWLESLGLARGSLRAWGSVVTSAFDLAINAGCDPIVFAGLDLAFTGNRPYCRAATWEEDWARDVAAGDRVRPLAGIWRDSLARWSLVTEADVSGRPVQTAPHLQAFRNWIVEQTATLGRRIINGTGAGILHGGAIEQCALETALHSLPPVSGPDLQARLRAAHLEHAGRVAPGTVQDAIAAQIAATSADAEGPEIQRWQRFAPAIAPGQMVEALRRAQITGAGLGQTRVVAAAEPPFVPGLRIPPPERVATLRAVLDRRPVPDWVRASSDVRLPADASSDAFTAALARILDVPPLPVAALEELLAAMVLRDGAESGADAVPFRLLVAWAVRQRRGDAPGRITGLLSGSGSTSADVQLAAVLARVAPDKNAIGWVEPRLLTDEGIGRGVAASRLDARHAMVTPLGALQSIAVAEDGAHQLLPVWPRPIVGEVPWGTAGGALAWNNGDEPYVMLRPAAGASVTLEPLPFQPGATVLLQADGTALFPSHRGGLWEWKPGAGARCVANAPPCIGIAREGDAIRLDPVERDDADQPIRRMANHAWRWRAGALTPVPLDARGQRWAQSTADGWTAEAFPHADMIQLRRSDGAVFELACEYPVAVAWARGSLLTATCQGAVLLFPHLRQRLELARPDERGTNG